MQDISQKQLKNKVLWWLFVDGASRKNPGPSGAGIVIIKNGVPFFNDGIYLGKKTNNQAEYLALIYGLFVLSKEVNSNDQVRVISDSQLLVRQLNGQYRVKNALLKPLFVLAQNLCNPLNVVIEHVLREDNTQADAMANSGVDNKKRLPDDFLLFLQKHGIAV
jgi:ribonuclease HI